MSSSRRRVRAGSALGVLTAAAMLAGPALAAPAQAATPKYTVTIIKNPPSFQQVEVFGINNNGDIFGTANESGAQTQEAFLLKAGSTTMQFLGSPGDPGNTSAFADPFAINDSADVVGSVLSTSGPNADINVPVEWPDSATPTTVASLAAVAPNGGVAAGINDHGEIVGYAENPSGQGDKAYAIQGSTITALPALPNGGVDARALAVSSNGVIAGWGDTQTTDQMAVEWSSSGAISELAQLPNTLSSQAFAVNSSGVAVGDGILTTDGDAHAVMWAGGTVTDLNVPGTGQGDAMANAINDSGVIVGGGGNGHGFIYQNGTATDLNTLIAPTAGLTLGDATGISNNGVIVGTASNGQRNQTVGYILTPVS